MIFAWAGYVLRRTVVSSLVWAGLGVTAFAAVPTPELSVGSALQDLALRATTVVTGRVARIERDGDVITVTLTVEETLRGVAGATYAFREWAGLWPLGQSRYEFGQRATFFLHGSSKSGLSSPVDGSDGVVPVVQVAADQPAVLDVRRLSARLQRSVGTPLASAEVGSISLSDAQQLIRHAQEPVLHEPVRYPLPIGIVRVVPPKVLLRVPINAEVAR